MIAILKRQLGAVHVIGAVEADALQIFGLRWDVGPGPSYTTLDDALTAGALEVTEVSEAGRVPFLRVANKGDTMVLLMAGEQLIGAKQNRVLNASLLVKAGGRLEAPVSCVEAGRWGYRSSKFHSQGSSSHAFLRAKMAKYAYLNYRAHGAPASEQGEVWREVDRKLRAMETPSSSSALEDVYVRHRKRLERILRQAAVSDGSCGVAFAFGGQVRGVDLFDRPDTLARLLPKLVRAYAVDALEEPEESGRIGRPEVEAWLRSVSRADFERFDSPGTGDDVRITSKTMVGAALLLEGHPVHVELFPQTESGEPRAWDRTVADQTQFTSRPADARPAPNVEEVTPRPPRRRGILRRLLTRMLG